MARKPPKLALLFFLDSDDLKRVEEISLHAVIDDKLSLKEYKQYDEGTLQEIYTFEHWGDRFDIWLREAANT